MSYYEKALKMRPYIEKAAQFLPDDDALQVKGFYPKWDDLVEKGSVSYESGFKFRYGSDLYRCINANPTFQIDWIPGIGTESLYVRIDEMHKGTIEDPIPYSGNMVLENGKYYSQNNVVYLCNRDTVNPVYNSLLDLIGLYVEVAS